MTTTTDLREPLISPKESPLTVADIFRLKVDALKDLFKDDNLRSNEGAKIPSFSL
jgi:hypothetical protein